MRETSILCLPIGAIEQHGAHLPLNTDVVVAEELTRRIVARWGDELDLWQLPTIAVSLSREHDWAPGTLSLSIASFVALLRDLARDIVRALPARNLVIVNGHGGNRGVLDNLLHELAGDFSLNPASSIRSICRRSRRRRRAPTFTAARARPPSCSRSRRIWFAGA